MRELLGELFVTRLDVALKLALPYLIVGVVIGVVFFLFILLGRWIERGEWQRELERGNRMGEVVKEKIGKRDARIKQLTMRIARDEARLERSDERLRQMAGLLGEMTQVMTATTSEQARRRRA